MKAKVTVLGVELELEAKSEKELWQQIAFYQSLPTVCPIDDTPTRFGFRSPKGNDYYEIVNTNPHYYITFHVGQNKEGGALFASGDWSWWDYTNKEDIALAKWNTLTDAGKRMRKQILGAATNSTTTEQAPVATQAEESADLVAARKVLHALGQTYYTHYVDENGERHNWDDVRKATIEASNKRNGTSYTSSNDLPLADVQKWIVMLEKKSRALIQDMAEVVYSNAEEGVVHLVRSTTKGEARNLGDVSGVPLTHVLKAVADEYAIPL